MQYISFSIGLTDSCDDYLSVEILGAADSVPSSDGKTVTGGAYHAIAVVDFFFAGLPLLTDRHCPEGADDAYGANMAACRMSYNFHII